MYTIQDKLIADVKDYALHKKGMRDAGERIDKEARELLVELQKVKGWECMIKECEVHYAKYPKEFFKWCSVTHTDDAVQFVKGYSDGNEYEVLEISFRKSLKDQVRDRMEEIPDNTKDCIQASAICEDELRTPKKKRPIALTMLYALPLCIVFAVTITCADVLVCKLLGWHCDIYSIIRSIAIAYVFFIISSLVEKI